jgi:hypothetical protein
VSDKTEDQWRDECCGRCLDVDDGERKGRRTETEGELTVRLAWTEETRKRLKARKAVTSATLIVCSSREISIGSYLTVFSFGTLTVRSSD